jgi:hypothetical protein
MTVRLGVCWVSSRFGGCRLGAIDPQSVSRWSARSEARTNDLDADEDRRIVACTGGAGDRGVRSWCLLCTVVSGDGLSGPAGARRRPALSGCADGVVRSRDGRWGVPGDGAAAHSFRDVHHPRGWRRQGNGRSRPRTSADSWAGRAPVASGGHLLPGGWGERRLAQGAEPVMGATGQLARHRQRGAFATQPVGDGSVIVMIG